MDFHDFPMFLGKSGMDLMHPPKLCAALIRVRSAREAERDQDKGAEAAGRGEDGRDAAGRQCAAAVLGFRHKVLLPGLRLML